MFFEFIKWAIYVMLVIFVTNGLFNLVSNQLGHDCITKEDLLKLNQNLTEEELKKKFSGKKICPKTWFTELSQANKRSDERFLLTNDWMNVSCVITIIIMLQLFRTSQRKTNIEIDEKVIASSDYTIIVKHVPHEKENIDYDHELKNLFEEKGIKENDKNIPPAVVESINLCFDLSTQQELEKKKNAVIARKQKAIVCYQKNPTLPVDVSDGGKLTYEEAMKKFDEEIASFNKELLALENECAEGVTTKFCGIAFVSFLTEEMKNTVLSMHTTSWKDRLKHFCHIQADHEKEDLVFHNKKIVLEQAPEPSDIFWENQAYTTKNKILRRTLSLLLTVAILIGCCIIIYFLTKYQIKQATDAKTGKMTNLSGIVRFLGYLISIIIIGINIALGFAIKFLADFEKWSTRTRYNISIAKVLAIAMFLNTAIIQYVITGVDFSNFFGAGGLIVNQTIVFIMNSIIIVLKEVIYHPLLMKKLFRYLERRKGNKTVMTQKQAQELYENPQFDIASSYATTMNAMFFAAFYAPLIPIGIPLTICGLFGMYWCYKYNLLRRCTVKYMQSCELSIEMTEMLEYVVILYCFATVIFQDALSQGVSAFGYIALILGIGNAILPMQWVNEKIFVIKEDQAELMPYNEVEGTFTTDYPRENPATSKTAILAYNKKYDE